ncbi:MAG: hypothetical protein HUU20_03270 [Pirellulales bacterium]|nr:hypothetical protein [Pirellulales bacterium]
MSSSAHLGEALGSGASGGVAKYVRLDQVTYPGGLAGPEMLLKHLKDLLNRDGATALTELPDGIHSGLRREKCNGMFYFQAPRADGQGKPKGALVNT